MTICHHNSSTISYTLATMQFHCKKKEKKEGNPWWAVILPIVKKREKEKKKKEKHVVTNDFLSWESSCDLTE